MRWESELWYFLEEKHYNQRLRSRKKATIARLRTALISYVKDFITLRITTPGCYQRYHILQLLKSYLLYNMVRAEDSSKVNGVCSIITGRIFGCSKVFPKRSKYSRNKFLNSLGKNGSLFRAADKNRRFVNCPILKGNRINSLSSSFKSVSSRSWQNCTGSALILFLLRSKLRSDFLSVDWHKATLNDSKWLSLRLSSWRWIRSPIVAGSFFMWLWLKSNFLRFFKQSIRISTRTSPQ